LVSFFALLKLAPPPLPPPLAWLYWRFAGEL
jgi:hypothetical protein